MPRRLIACIVIALTLGLVQQVNATPRGGGGTPSALFTTSAEFCADGEEFAFLKLINDYRALNGLKPLVFSLTLSAASEHHAIDMATWDYVDHTLHDGTTWSQNISNHGYTYTTYRGENVGASYTTAERMFLAWKGSSGHNANMLNSTYKAIGIGRAYSATGRFGWYWTTDFGGYVDAAVTCTGPASTPTPTKTPTRTPTPSAQNISTTVPTATATVAAATNTPVPPATSTATPTRTSTPEPTATSTPTSTPTQTATTQPTATRTPIPPTAVPTTAPVLTVYVSGLKGQVSTRKGSSRLSITASVANSKGAAVSGATIAITVMQPDGSGQRLTGTTNNRGQATWTVNANAGSGNYGASVNNVSASGYSYDPNANSVASISMVVP